MPLLLPPLAAADAAERRKRRARAFRLKGSVIVAFFLLFVAISDVPRLHGGAGAESWSSPACGSSEDCSRIPRGGGWPERVGSRPWGVEGLEGLGSRRVLLKKAEDPEPEEDGELCGSRINLQKDRCAYVKKHCVGAGEGIIDYTYFHYCTMRGRESLSIAALVGVVMLAFYLLGETAEEYFCPVVKKMTHVLDMSPNTAGVTFLAFGNGAPDVFASLAAFVGGDGKIGLGAIVSAGSFVAAFVVGSVALAAAPVEVRPRPYLRDVLFYLVGAVGVFMVTITGEIHLWQASLFLAYYVFFVAVVVVSDRIGHRRRAASTQEQGGGRAPATPPKGSAAVAGGGEATWDTSETTSYMATAIQFKSGRGAQPRSAAPQIDSPGSPPSPKHPLSPSRALMAGTFAGDGHPEPPLGAPPYGDGKDKMPEPSFVGVIRTYWYTWCADFRELSGWEKAKSIAYQPFDIARRATIPTVEDSEWNKLYACANTMFGPLVMLGFFGDFVDFSHPIGGFGLGRAVPLWGIVLAQSTLLAVAQWKTTSYHAPPAHTGPFVAMAFATSIAWISGSAQELLGCLSALGTIIGISPSILGVTVLAWGNSVGDLVADVAIARAGEPSMAVAGCYAGPMFNMLIGLGMAFTIKTSSMYPTPYALHYHPNVPMSFGFLFATLVGSAATVPLSGFRLTRPWGICLIALYLIFMVLSVLVETKVMRI